MVSFSSVPFQYIRFNLQQIMDYMQASHDEAVKQRDSLVNEVASLRVELQQVRDDRDSLLLQVQTLTAEVVKYKESTESSCSQLDNLTTKTNELEVLIFYFFCGFFVCDNFYSSWQTFQVIGFFSGKMHVTEQ